MIRYHEEEGGRSSDKVEHEVYVKLLSECPSFSMCALRVGDPGSRPETRQEASQDTTQQSTQNKTSNTAKHTHTHTHKTNNTDATHKARQETNQGTTQQIETQATCFECRAGTWMC